MAVIVKAAVVVNSVKQSMTSKLHGQLVTRLNVWEYAVVRMQTTQKFVAGQRSIPKAPGRFQARAAG
ncbi:MAG: hypothetical protein AUK51_00195 [Comamonadaceae bacterium CG2_30_59_20]|nr:MAG: hypothetical protein AUK51_00195 [Comamonadaceae bacterium CG2_30_59_20]